MCAKKRGTLVQVQVEHYWLECLTHGPRRFGDVEFADMLEETGWFPGDFQRALGNLMEAGKVRNLDAQKKASEEALAL